MAVLMDEISMKASAFQKKIDTANTSMRNMGITSTDQKLVRDYLFYTQTNQENQ